MSEVLCTVAKLSPRVFRILGLNPGPMTLQGSNTYLVGTGQDRVLIDSGEGKPSYADVLREALHRASSDIGSSVRISHLLLTHGHQDHVGGVNSVREMFPQVALLKKKSAFFDSPEEKLCSPPPSILKVDGATLRVISTPGHTDDHLCFFLEEEQAIFTGDTILGTGTSVFACYHEYMHTLKVIKDYQPALLYPAHGPTVADGAKRAEDIIHHRLQREKQIIHALAHASEPQSIMNLVEQLYTSTPKNLYGAAAINVFHHVKKLVKDGIVDVTKCFDQSILGDASDYSLLGENARATKELRHQMFHELLFCLRASETHKL